MIRSLEVNQYRKFKQVTLNFNSGINALSGTNGTCKTSLLHMVSNSFQAVTTKCSWMRDPKCLSIINAINKETNPKVESLTRGDKKYNDPARGFQGTLYTANYYDHSPLEFRRHNSKLSTRYAVKPYYKAGTKDSLPCCPVIYLGLSRLLPYGEYSDDSAITGISQKLPGEYQREIARLYKQFTGIGIEFSRTQNMGEIKVRADFDGDKEGIDSNTISAGEDNLHIILTALISLKYYFESINSTRKVESILLIDELDATLHPAFQIKLLNLMAKFADEYKIQVIVTTHSLTVMEEMLSCKYNILYLLDNETSVCLMDEPDIFKIKMHLQALTEVDIYHDRVIPIFTEDEEAKFILEHLLTYFEDTKKDEFYGVRRFLHFVNAKAGAEVLTGIFSDSKLLQITMRSICILDGDHQSNFSNCIIALPGGKAPEQFLIEYAEQLYQDDDPFWVAKEIIRRGYGKRFYREFKAEIDKFEADCIIKKENGESTKGDRRDFNKSFFEKNEGFFDLLIKHWLHNEINQNDIMKFYRGLRTMFKKIAPYNAIDPNTWK